MDKCLAVLERLNVHVVVDDTDFAVYGYTTLFSFEVILNPSRPVLRRMKGCCIEFYHFKETFQTLHDLARQQIIP